MKKISLILSLGALFLAGCQDFDYGDLPIEVDADEEAIRNASLALGVKIDTSHDWSTTNSSSVTIAVDADLEDIVKVQILTCSPFGSTGNGSTVLNETTAKKGESVTLSYDAPQYLERLFVACVSSVGEYYIKGFAVGQESVSFLSSETGTRATISYYGKDIKQPDNPKIANIEKSYNNQWGNAGWENDNLYQLSDKQEDERLFSLENYDSNFIEDLYDIIFTYLPNKVSNVEKVRESKYYNNCYIKTTGVGTILVEPIYKSDGTSNEVTNSHLYYYYFKDEDIAGMSEEEQVQYFKALPKYRGAQLFRSVRQKYASLGMQNDVIRKNTAYAIIYWGDGLPEKGKVGSYQFPAGYRIGFMLRSLHGKNNKKGELYSDGRLNVDINKYGDFRSSKLEETDSRMAWIGANGRTFLCCETGADRDFNDLVLEVEGGIEQISELGSPYGQIYTFCFEDREKGDYDLNDIVIKAVRKDQKHVEYSLEPCHGADKVYLRNINGKKLNGKMEVHEIIKMYNNAGEEKPVTELIEIDPSFTFKDLDKQIYIYNETMGTEIRLSKIGQDPHAIIVPSDFEYPKEGVPVQEAYPAFINWAYDRTQNVDWYISPEVVEKVYRKSSFLFNEK